MSLRGEGRKEDRADWSKAEKLQQVEYSRVIKRQKCLISYLCKKEVYILSFLKCLSGSTQCAQGNIPHPIYSYLKLNSSIPLWESALIDRNSFLEIEEHSYRLSMHTETCSFILSPVTSNNTCAALCHSQLRTLELMLAGMAYNQLTFKRPEIKA